LPFMFSLSVTAVVHGNTFKTGQGFHGLAERLLSLRPTVS
jgi:hypothetical protein